MSAVKTFFSKTLALTAYDFCDLHAIEDDYTFVTADGFYCSVLFLSGSKQYLGDADHPEAIEAIADQLTALWQAPGRQIQTVFIQDPERGAEFEAGRKVAQLYETGKRLGLNIEPIVDERKENWSRTSYYESSIIVVKTSLSALAKGEQEKAVSAASRAPYASLLQDPSRAFKKLRAKHNTFVKSLNNALGKFCILEHLSVYKAAALIDQCITGRYNTGFKLRVSKNRSAPPPRLQENSRAPGDPSNAMQPPIAHQFFRETPRKVEGEPSLIKIHGHYVAPIQVETWADRPVQFNEFVKKVEQKYPFRISFTFLTGKDSVRGFIAKSYRLARLAQIFNKENAHQASAAKVLLEYMNEGGKSANALKCHMTACTWGRSKEETIERKEDLSGALASWCGLGVVEYLDDPAKLWLETLPAVARRPVSVPSAIELRDALTYLPFDRPGTFFNEGPMPFFSVDNKFMPFMMGAQFQSTWNNNWLAPPGSGKSVGMFGSCLGLTLNPENRQLPKQVFIDIGHAGRGLAKLYKALLGTEKAHRSVHRNIRNDGSDRINPFGTMTCVRYQTQTEFDDLKSILLALYSPAEGQMPEHLDVIIPELARKAFDMCSDTCEPKTSCKVYRPNTCKEIDERLQRGDITLPEKPLWWEVADELLYHGEERLAGIATSQAVPILRDLARVISTDEDVKRKYGDLPIAGMDASRYIKLYTENAANEYKILAGPTNFDVSDIDMLVLNLQEVVNSETAGGKKMSAIMFLLAMIASSREFFQRPDVVDTPGFSKDPRVVNYHRERIKANFETKSHLVLDEYHVTKGVPFIDPRILFYRRVGRKNNTVVSLATHFETDISDEQNDIASNTFFMSSDGRSMMERRQERFKFGDDIKELALQEMTSPGKMLHFSKNKQQVSWQVIKDMKGPIELWAYSSSNDDLSLRDSLESHVGFWEACRILAKEFPGGSIGNFSASYMAYLERAYDNHDDKPALIKNWHKSLAKQIIYEPDTWRMHLVEEL